MLMCNNTRRTRTSKRVQYYISGVAARKDEKLSQLFWITSRMLNTHLFTKLLHKIRIIKNVDEKIEGIEKQLDEFHTSNREIYKKPKLLTKATILTFCQFVAMFMVSYFIYRALGFNAASPVQIMSCQAYVNLMSGMIPIPGASGAAELGFTAFFSVFFLHGTLKSAALIWRFINYYLVVFVTAPFAYLSKDKTDAAKAEEEKQIKA